MILPNGAMLGRYRIDGVLGQGQTGIVYRAFDSAIERTVAVKCLKTGAPRVGREGERSLIDVLFEEAKVIGQLNHPHITAVYDMGSSDGVPFVVMEYVHGETLKARLVRSSTEPAFVPQILSFIVMVARALHYVHLRGILHGDIKPGNLIVTPQGTPKIMDFGVARRSQTDKPAKWSLAGEKSVWGTPGYIAPEQLRADEIDARADVFSLGVIAYEWLAGRRPFWGTTEEAALKALLEGPLTPLSELGQFDPELSETISQALVRDPAQRIRSADALADALEVCQERWHRQVSNSGLTDSGESTPSKTFPKLSARSVLFADFSSQELATVMQLSRSENYPAGDTIFQQGSGGSTMYIVVRGRVSIRKISELRNQEVEIGQLVSGECFGEMAIVSQMPRSATVVALSPTEVIAISGAVLRSANQELCLKLYRNIASVLADRVRQQDEQVLSLIRNEASTGVKSGVLQRIAEKLTRGLGV